MKYTFPLILLLFLVSCKSANIPEKHTSKLQTEVKNIETEEQNTKNETISTPANTENTLEENTSQKVHTEIQTELDNLETEEQKEENIPENETKIIKTTYENSWGTMNLHISYKLDENGKISELTATSDTNPVLESYAYRITNYALGKTPAEATNLYISGASLTSDAFNKAIKEHF